MVTKGIIKKVIPSNYIDNLGYSHVYYKYKVSMPIFQGYKGYSEKNLPEAIYSLPPHMEATRLHVGDVVFVSSEDMKVDNLVIIGLVPVVRNDDLYGSSQTDSKVSIKDTDEIIFNKNGTAVLPKNTKIKIDTSDNLIYYGDNKNYVDTSELKNIVGLNKNISQFITETENSLSVLNNKLNSLQAVISVKKGVFNNLSINQSTWFVKSGMIDEGKKIVVLIKYKNQKYEVKINNEDSTILELKTKYGISFSDMLDEEGLFQVEVISGILPVKYGGTGLQSRDDIIKSFGIQYIRKYIDNLLDALVDNNIITQDQREDIEEAAKVPSSKSSQSNPEAQTGNHPGVLLAAACGDVGGDNDASQTTTPDFQGELRIHDFSSTTGENKAPYTQHLRFTRTADGIKFAKLIIAACNNKNIGYNRNSRNSLRDRIQQVANSKYSGNISKITPEDIETLLVCQCDCSSLVCSMVNVIVGYDLSGGGNSYVTAEMFSPLISTGRLYSVGDQPLFAASNMKVGDILIRPGQHTSSVVSVSGSSGL